MIVELIHVTRSVDRRIDGHIAASICELPFPPVRAIGASCGEHFEGAPFCSSSRGTL